jgi:hypothetical protein
MYRINFHPLLIFCGSIIAPYKKMNYESYNLYTTIEIKFSYINNFPKLYLTYIVCNNVLSTHIHVYIFSKIYDN